MSNARARRDWIAFAGMAAVGVVAMATVTPRAYQDIRASRALIDHGTTMGEVVLLDTNTGRATCSSSATVRYKVNGKTYSVKAVGCGAAATYTSLGERVRVEYSRFNPSVAKVSVHGAKSSNMGWSTIFGGWGFVIVCGVMAVVGFRKERVQ